MKSVIDQPRAGSPTFHPGIVLRDELTELEIGAAELAHQIGVPSNRISQLVNGKRPVTGDTVLRMGPWFGISPQFWLNLQSAYDPEVARRSAGADIAKLLRRPAA